MTLTKPQIQLLIPTALYWMCEMVIILLLQFHKMNIHWHLYVHVLMGYTFFTYTFLVLCVHLFTKLYEIYRIVVEHWKARINHVIHHQNGYIDNRQLWYLTLTLFWIEGSKEKEKNMKSLPCFLVWISG